MAQIITARGLKKHIGKEMTLEDPLESVEGTLIETPYGDSPFSCLDKNGETYPLVTGKIAGFDRRDGVHVRYPVDLMSLL